MAHGKDKVTAISFCSPTEWWPLPNW